MQDWVRKCMYMEVEGGEGPEGGQERPGWKWL